MRSILLLLVFAFAAPLIAQTTIPQTTIPPGMMRRWGGGSLSDLRLFAVALDGVAQVRLGPGLKIEDRAGVLTLVAAEPQLRIVSQVLQRDIAANYPCSQCQRIFRNGLRMAEGIDYRQMPTGVMPLHPWAADDVVVGEWVGVGPTLEANRRAIVPAAQMSDLRRVSLIECAACGYGYHRAQPYGRLSTGPGPRMRFVADGPRVRVVVDGPRVRVVVESH